MATIHYLENQFLNATAGSATLMHTVIADHYPKLMLGALTDATLVPVRDRTLAPYDNLRNAVATYLSRAASRKGATQQFEQALRQLSSTLIKQWDIQIQNVYIEGTPEYTALLPNGRGPFQNGAYEERVAQVVGLAQRLTGIVPLAATLASVGAFRDDLITWRDEQTQKEGALSVASDDMETARVAAAWICYRNLGFLMDKYWNDLERVDNFYQFDLITNTGTAPEEGTTYTGTVGTAATAEVANRDFSTVTNIRLVNTGTATLAFCRNTASAAPCSGGSEKLVAPGDSTDVSPADLGTGTFLNATNHEPAMAGSYEVIVF